MTIAWGAFHAWNSGFFVVDDASCFIAYQGHGLLAAKERKKRKKNHNNHDVRSNNRQHRLGLDPQLVDRIKNRPGFLRRDVAVHPRPRSHSRHGQSLVVWAINEGRGCAREVDRYLMGDTILP